MRFPSAGSYLRDWYGDRYRSTEPATTRGPGPGAALVGGSLRQWFDVIVHRQEVTPARTP